MRIIKLIFILTIIFLHSYAYSSNPGTLRTSLIEGDVFIKAYGTTEWIPVEMNMPLIEGDELDVTGSGRLEIHTSSGSFLRFNGGSRIIIDKVEDDAVNLYMSKGDAYINSSGAGYGVLLVETPAASVRAYKGAIYRTNLTGHNFLEISVFKGKVYAENENENETTTVQTGTKLKIGTYRFAVFSSVGFYDEWERWNLSRDRAYKRSLYSSRHLPAKLKIYSHDFDSYGRWVYVSDYGYVWKPYISLSSGWAPYSSGRWLLRSNDYVWIAYEPWGWAPHHYGRWDFSVSIGWFWVPPDSEAIFWGPGFVGWIYNADYIAWVPLAPEDIYYGYGFYGPQSVNILKIVRRHSLQNVVYKNVYINNSITIVYKDSFYKGKHKYFRKKKKPFLMAEVFFGHPYNYIAKKTVKTIVKDAHYKDKQYYKAKKIRLSALKERGIEVKREKVKYGTSRKKRSAAIYKTKRKPGTSSSLNAGSLHKKERAPERHYYSGHEYAGKYKGKSTPVMKKQLIRVAESSYDTFRGRKINTWKSPQRFNRGDQGFELTDKRVQKRGRRGY